MTNNKLELNKIILGNCIQELKKIPSKSIDMVFADPPYNLQLNNRLIRPDNTTVDAVDDYWDKFESMSAYDDFCFKWLTEIKRVMKDDATIWGLIFGGVGLWFSYLVVILFTGLVAYETQQIKYIYSHFGGYGENADKIAVFCALNLYLSFINIFTSLLNIMGSNRE